MEDYTLGTHHLISSNKISSFPLSGSLVTFNHTKFSCACNPGQQNKGYECKRTQMETSNNCKRVNGDRSVAMVDGEHVTSSSAGTRPTSGPCHHVVSLLVTGQCSPIITVPLHHILSVTQHYYSHSIGKTGTILYSGGVFWVSLKP